MPLWKEVSLSRQFVSSVHSFLSTPTDEPQTALYTKKDLIETHIKPATLELAQRLQDDFSELEEQIGKQLERFEELRLKRDANPGTSLFFHDRS